MPKYLRYDLYIQNRFILNNYNELKIEACLLVYLDKCVGRASRETIISEISSE